MCTNGEHQVVYIKLDFEHPFVSLHGWFTHFGISDEECMALLKVLAGN